MRDDGFSILSIAVDIGTFLAAFHAYTVVDGVSRVVAAAFALVAVGFLFSMIVDLLRLRPSDTIKARTILGLAVILVVAVAWVVPISLNVTTP